MSLMNQFKNNPFFRDMYRQFYLVRGGNTISSDLEGFFCSNKYPSSIQLCTEEIIHDGDCLVDVRTNNKYLIDNVKPLSNNEYILHYTTPSQAAHIQNAPISIGEIHGNAIVGSQTNATINIGSSFDDIRQYIDSASMSAKDREDMHKLVKAVEAAIENDMNISGGVFKKYAHLVEKHEPIIAAIAQPVIQWLLGK